MKLNEEKLVGKVLRVAWNPNPVFNEMWFLTIDPFIRLSVFIAKLSERQYCWRVFEDLHDFVKVSISAEFKSFLLITCIDAPESTTNSRSSGSSFDADKHPFSEGEKNVALSCSFNFNTFLASFHAASREPCSCHSVSS